MENGVSVMIKMLPLFKFTISCHGEASLENVTMCVRISAEAVSDWLNPLSLGTMPASAYIENLA